MKITSTANSHIKEISLLHKTGERKKQKFFLVQGEDFLSPALQSGLALEVFSLKELDTQGIPLTLIDTKVMNKLSLYEQSIAPIILCKYPEKEKTKGKKMIYLDGIQDPGNVGTILRTACAFSYDKVYLSPTCASLYSAKTLSATKGSIFQIDCYEDVTLDSIIDKNMEIIVTSLRDAEDYKKIEIKKPFLLIFGNEGRGVSENALKVATKIVKIKMDFMESLNVAVAAGILMERYR